MKRELVIFVNIQENGNAAIISCKPYLVLEHGYAFDMVARKTILSGIFHPRID